MRSTRWPGDSGPSAVDQRLVDTSYLELVRLGVEPADDPDIVQALDVVDSKAITGPFSTPPNERQKRVLRKHVAIPLRINSARQLVVAVSDPSNLYALEDLRIISGYQITPVVATEDDIRNTQAKVFATGEQIARILEETADEQEWLERRIRTNIGKDPRTAEMPRINVEVNAGVAELRGAAISEDAKLAAGEIAQHVEGVREVRNLITVS